MIDLFNLPFNLAKNWLNMKSQYSIVAKFLWFLAIAFFLTPCCHHNDTIIGLGAPTNSTTLTTSNNQIGTTNASQVVSTTHNTTESAQTATASKTSSSVTLASTNSDCNIAKPIGVVVRTCGDVVLLIEWDQVESATAYKIYRSQSKIDYSEIGISETNKYEDTISTTDMTTFYYKIAATNDFCESEQSEVAEGSTWQKLDANQENNWGALPDTGQSISFVPGDDASYGNSVKDDYADNSDGTVTDTITKLIWQKGGKSCSAWREAIIYCDNLVLAKFEDWRMPSISELHSLVDYGKSSGPAINTIFFEVEKNDLSVAQNYYSTTFDYRQEFVWVLWMEIGDVYVQNILNQGAVRCVRP